MNFKGIRTKSGVVISMEGVVLKGDSVVAESGDILLFEGHRVRNISRSTSFELNSAKVLNRKRIIPITSKKKIAA